MKEEKDILLKKIQESIKGILSEANDEIDFSVSYSPRSGVFVIEEPEMPTEVFMAYWGYSPTSDIFWMDNEHIYEVFMHDSYKYVIRRVVFDKCLLLRARNRNLEQEDVPEGVLFEYKYDGNYNNWLYADYWEDEDQSREVVAVVDNDTPLFKLLFDERYEDIVLIDDSLGSKTVIACKDGDGVAFYDECGYQHHSFDLASQSNKTSQKYDIRYNQSCNREAYLSCSTMPKLKATHIKGRYAWTVASKSELCGALKDKKFGKDYKVYNMTHDVLIIRFDGETKLQSYNCFGVRIDGKNEGRIHSISKELNSQLKKRLFEAKNNPESSEGLIKTADKYESSRNKSLDNESQEIPKVEETPKAITPQQVTERIYPIIHKEVDELEDIEYTSKRQRIVDTLANKRGSRVYDDRCDYCGAKFKHGWLYKAYDHEEFAICSTCKANLSKGKMNYRKMVVG